MRQTGECMTDTPGATRHLSLDALRGIAVMGILVMNIVAFSMPQQAYFNPAAWGGTEGANLATWAVNFILVDGKMRGLFSVLFGASMLLVIDGAEAKGESGVKTHARRMLWLAAFGLAHYYLIWFGDILFLYAVTGFLAFLFRNRPVRSLVKWAVFFLVMNFIAWSAAWGAMTMFASMATQPGADAEAVKGYQSMLEGVGAPGSTAIAKELLVYGGDYAGIWGLRAVEGLLFPFIAVPINIVETLGFMLLGMALYRSGFLTGRWDRAAYKRMALRCYAVGLPGMALIAWFVWSSGFEPVRTFGSFFSAAAPFRVLLILAHASLAILLITRHAEGALVRRIAAAGRAAFTNYLGTSIVMTTIFYGYGLGLFGTIERWQIWPFILGAWAIMLLWSLPWLKRFHYGPMEWLWRTLARGSLQPIRRD